MEEITTTSILSLFQTNKEQRLSFVNDVINRINEGFVDPLLIHLQVKCMEDIIKQLTSDKRYQDAILEAAEKQDSKSFQFHNAKFEVKEVGIKWHFDKTGDPEIESLLKSEADLKKKIKYRQEYLKSIPKEGINVLNESSGEVVKIYPAYKTSTTSIAVTLK